MNEVLLAHHFRARCPYSSEQNSVIETQRNFGTRNIYCKAGRRKAKVLFSNQPPFPSEVSISRLHESLPFGVTLLQTGVTIMVAGSHITCGGSYHSPLSMNSGIAEVEISKYDISVALHKELSTQQWPFSSTLTFYHC